MSSVKRYLLVPLALCLPRACEAMRRKATESVDLSETAAAEAAVKEAVGPGGVLTEGAKEEDPSCPGLLWKLSLSSRHGQGWNGTSLLILGCEGDLLANATLASGHSREESMCLPAKVMVRLPNATVSGDVQWSLKAGNSSLEGGAPFNAGLCSKEPSKLEAAAAGKEAAARETAKVLGMSLWPGFEQIHSYFAQKWAETVSDLSQQTHRVLSPVGPSGAFVFAMS